MTRFAPLWQQAGSYPAQLDRSLGPRHVAERRRRTGRVGRRSQ